MSAVLSLAMNLISKCTKGKSSGEVTEERLSRMIQSARQEALARHDMMKVEIQRAVDMRDEMKRSADKAEITRAELSRSLRKTETDVQLLREQIRQDNQMMLMYRKEPHNGFRLALPFALLYVLFRFETRSKA